MVRFWKPSSSTMTVAPRVSDREAPGLETVLAHHHGDPGQPLGQQPGLVPCLACGEPHALAVGDHVDAARGAAITAAHHGGGGAEGDQRERRELDQRRLAAAAERQVAERDHRDTADAEWRAGASRRTARGPARPRDNQRRACEACRQHGVGFPLPTRSVASPRGPGVDAPRTRCSRVPFPSRSSRFHRSPCRSPLSSAARYRSTSSRVARTPPCRRITAGEARLAHGPGEVRLLQEEPEAAARAPPRRPPAARRLPPAQLGAVAEVARVGAEEHGLRPQRRLEHIVPARRHQAAPHEDHLGEPIQARELAHRVEDDHGLTPSRGGQLAPAHRGQAPAGQEPLDLGGALGVTGSEDEHERRDGPAGGARRRRPRSLPPRDGCCPRSTGARRERGRGASPTARGFPRSPARRPS